MNRFLDDVAGPVFVLVPFATALLSMLATVLLGNA
jgi:hypothetical protein